MIATFVGRGDFEAAPPSLIIGDIGFVTLLSIDRSSALLYAVLMDNFVSPVRAYLGLFALPEVLRRKPPHCGW